MPKYELMYIIGSETSDDKIPSVIQEVQDAIKNSGGLMDKHEKIGKKRLAYPIKKSKTGFYVLDNFSSPADQIGEIEHKIRTNQNIVRHLAVNMDEALERIAKDKAAQSKLQRTRPSEETKTAEATQSRPTTAKPEKKIQIDLDAEIEKALESEDLK